VSAPEPRDRPLIDAFLDALWMERGLARNTLDAYGSDLARFARWLEGRGLGLAEARREHLLDWLASHGSAPPRSNARRLSTLRRFYQYLVREQRLREDPSALIEAPRLGRPLPHALTETEVEELLQAPDPEDVLGLRDRTMLELLYATGLRVSELVGLARTQVSLRQGVLRVVGKGSKERLVPFGEEAGAWLERYLTEGRPELARGRAGEALFPTRRGGPMTRQAFWQLIRR
jgi:integrase/recombinase XerD